MGTLARRRVFVGREGACGRFATDCLLGGLSVVRVKSSDVTVTVWVTTAKSWGARKGLSVVRVKSFDATVTVWDTTTKSWGARSVCDGCPQGR